MTGQYIKPAVPNTDVGKGMTSDLVTATNEFTEQSVPDRR
jgi:hypothetical protein